MLQGLTMGVPSVYVWVRQMEAWKLHPYNFIVLIYVSFKFFLPNQNIFWKKFLNFVVMAVDDSVSKQY